MARKHERFTAEITGYTSEGQGVARAPDGMAVFVRDAIAGEVKRIGHEGIDSALWNRLKKAAFGSRVRGLNSFENIAIAQAEGVFHGYDYYDFPAIFSSIAKADIEDFLRRSVTEERTAISIITPKA